MLIYFQWIVEKSNRMPWSPTQVEKRAGNPDINFVCSYSYHSQGWIEFVDQ